MKFKIVTLPQVAVIPHVYFRIYANGANIAAGQLCMRKPEFQAFKHMLQVGSSCGEAKITFEEESE